MTGAERELAQAMLDTIDHFKRIRKTIVGASMAICVTATLPASYGLFERGEHLALAITLTAAIITSWAAVNLVWGK